MRRAPPGSRRGCRFLLGAALLAGVAGLLLCEIAVRAFELAPLPAPQAQGSTLRAIDDPVRRFENAPGGKLVLTYVDAHGADPRVVEATVNAQGFRGRELPEERAAGTLRIACLGDSHTFGYGVGAGEAWPELLEQELRRRPGSPPLEVLNGGVNGYDTEQEALWLEERVLRYRPDFVLLAFHLNDTSLRGQELSPSQKPGLLLRWTDPASEGWLAPVRRRSRFADLLADAVYRRLSLGLFASAREELFAEDHPAWIRTRAALRRARERTEASGGRFAVVLFPFLVREGEHLASHRAFATVAQFLRGERIPLLDLEPAYAGLDVDRLRLHPHDYHANAQAHRICAEAVATWLLEQGWVGAAK